MIPIEIIYEEGPCLVALKPSGLATQAPPQFDSLEKRLRAWLAEREAGARPIYLGVPHRLDRPVSGAVLFATRRRAAFKISRQFERRQIKKIYWACVEGHVQPAEGVWTDHLRKIYGHPRAEIVSEHDDGAQLAVLRYRTLGTTSFGSWLEIDLETGRTHQIRVQAASRGHPVLGDAFYGGVVPFGEAFQDERLRAIALHGRSLGFQHPTGGQWVTVVAELSDSWRELLNEVTDS